MKKILERFRKPVPSDPPEFKKVAAAAHRCLNNSEGEFLMEHLIEFFGVDEPSGCLPSDESNYKNGTQDVVKYILGLLTDKEQ